MMQRIRQIPALLARQRVARSGCRSGIASGTARYLSQVALACLMLCSGCATFQGLQDQIRYSHGIYDVTTRWQDRYRAFCAWQRHAWAFRGEPYRHDFAAGFREGYCDVANGEDGCPPPLAPREYWNHRYENFVGQQRISAWFAGYAHGVAVAEDEAAGIFRPIRLSAEVQRRLALDRALREAGANRELEAVPAGQAEPEGSPEAEPVEQPPEPSPDEPPASVVTEAATASLSPARGLLGRPTTWYRR